MSLSSIQPTALRRYRLFESNDLDETRERISSVMQPHRLQPTGVAASSRAHMDFTRLGTLGMGTISFGSPMRVDVGAVDGYHLLMFCVNGQASVASGGGMQDVDREHAVLCAPGERFDARLSADCEQFILRVDPQALAAHTGHDTPLASRWIDLTRPALRPWLQQLRVIAGSPELLACAQNHPLVALELERLLLCLLAAGMGGDAAAEETTAGHGHLLAPASVRAAEDFIRMHAGDPLRLADIAAAVGLPSRTLLDSFRRFRDTSPMRYLRQVRLQQARDNLRAAAPGMTVSQIALDCGFAHLGRFAQAYMEAFGETPSQTLKGR